MHCSVQKKRMQSMVDIVATLYLENESEQSHGIMMDGVQNWKWKNMQEW